MEGGDVVDQGQHLGVDPVHAALALPLQAQAAARGLVQALPARMQAAAIAPYLDQLPFRLSPELSRRIGDAAGGAAGEGEDVEVVVRGKPEQFNRPDYSFRLDAADADGPLGDEAVTITTRQRGDWTRKSKHGSCR